MGLRLLSLLLNNVLAGRIMGDFDRLRVLRIDRLGGVELFDQDLVGLGFLATLLSYPMLRIAISCRQSTLS